MKNVLIVDGQGGRIGRALAERLAAAAEKTVTLTVVGTNAVATANMLKGCPDARASQQQKTAYTLWVRSWTADPEPYVDHSLDDFE